MTGQPDPTNTNLDDALAAYRVANAALAAASLREVKRLVTEAAPAASRIQVTDSDQEGGGLIWTNALADADGNLVDVIGDENEFDNALFDALASLDGGNEGTWGVFEVSGDGRHYFWLDLAQVPDVEPEPEPEWTPSPSYYQGCRDAIVLTRRRQRPGGWIPQLDQVIADVDAHERDGKRYGQSDG
jgi:hypothetical protein